MVRKGKLFSTYKAAIFYLRPVTVIGASVFGVFGSGGLSNALVLGLSGGLVLAVLYAALRWTVVMGTTARELVELGWRHRFRSLLPYLALLLVSVIFGELVVNGDLSELVLFGLLCSLLMWTREPERERLEANLLRHASRPRSSHADSPEDEDRVEHYMREEDQRRSPFLTTEEALELAKEADARELGGMRMVDAVPLKHAIHDLWRTPKQDIREPWKSTAVRIAIQLVRYAYRNPLEEDLRLVRGIAAHHQRSGFAASPLVGSMFVAVVHEFLDALLLGLFSTCFLFGIGDALRDHDFDSMVVIMGSLVLITAIAFLQFRSPIGVQRHNCVACKTPTRRRRKLPTRGFRLAICGRKCLGDLTRAVQGVQGFSA